MPKKLNGMNAVDRKNGRLSVHLNGRGRSNKFTETHTQTRTYTHAHVSVKGASSERRTKKVTVIKSLLAE